MNFTRLFLSEKTSQSPFVTGERRFFAYWAPYSTRSIIFATAEHACCISAAGREAGQGLVSEGLAREWRPKHSIDWCN